MVYHVLNGGALVERFQATGLPGEMVVARECLIEGDLHGESPEEFFQSRAGYLSAKYGTSGKDYFAEVAAEFRKLLAAPDESEFNLWFGYDLFCRANMWFVLSLLNDLPIRKEVFVVYPSYLKENEIWKDFGHAKTGDLLRCFDNRTRLNEKDIRFGKDLWRAYKNGDFENLKALSQHQSGAFPYLHEVCRAHIERFPADGSKGRPEKVVEAIVQSGAQDFYSVFREFFKREGIYGFGDDQVKDIYNRVLEERNDELNAIK